MHGPYENPECPCKDGATHEQISYEYSQPFYRIRTLFGDSTPDQSEWLDLIEQAKRLSRGDVDWDTVDICGEILGKVRGVLDVTKPDAIPGLPFVDDTASDQGAGRQVSLWIEGWMMFTVRIQKWTCVGGKWMADPTIEQHHTARKLGVFRVGEGGGNEHLFLSGKTRFGSLISDSTQYKRACGILAKSLWCRYGEPVDVTAPFGR